VKLVVDEVQEDAEKDINVKLVVDEVQEDAEKKYMKRKKMMRKY
jgi:hypothetical protein